MAPARLRVAVAGGTGYTGIELVRLLLLHPRVDLIRVTSEQYAGQSLTAVVPSFVGRTELGLERLDAERLAEGTDLVFSALPHGTAASTVAAVLGQGVPVVDLSADFRIRDAGLFRKWYGEHPVPTLLEEAVYGIPEFSREAIRGSRLVANPGCYPTGALFGLLPLVRAGLVGEGTLVVDSKSGATGAGRAAKTQLLFGEVAENVRAYAVGAHRHTPELEQELRRAGSQNAFIFTPHLLPIRRGILSTLYVPLREAADLGEAFRRSLHGEPFVRLLGEGRFPNVADVRGTNDVHIGWGRSENHAIVVTAIDNLGRGAAAQAVQNMNLMVGFDETEGLTAIAAVP